MVKSRLPILQKAWQTSVNNAAALGQSTLVNNQKTMFTIKDGLVSFANNPWTVFRSSNSVNVTGDIDPATVPDETVNGNDGTTVGITLDDITNSVPRDTFTQHSFDLDGSADYIDLGDEPYLTFERDEAFSVSAWIRTSSTANGAIISRRDDGSNRRGWEFLMLGTSGGILRFDLININSSNEIRVESTASVNDGDWHHIIVTYDGSSAASGISIYVDGVAGSSVDADTLSGTIIEPSIIASIGSRNGAVNLFEGKIADVAAFSKELSSLEVAELYNSGTPHDLRLVSFDRNIISWWRCGTGDFPGRFQAIARTYQTSDRVIVDGYDPLTTSLLLNNDTIQDEYVDFGTFAEIDFSKTDAFSAGLWIKYDDNGGWTLMSKNTGNTTSGTFDGWRMYTDSDVDAGDFIVEFGNGTGDVFSASNTDGLLNDGNWHFVMFTYDGSNDPAGLTLYIDGIDSTSATSGSALPNNINNTGGLRVGGQTDHAVDGYEFIGNVCHSSVYDAELSAIQVRGIYRRGFPQDLSDTDPSGNLVHWSTLGDGCSIGTNGCFDLSGLGNHGTTVNVDAGDFVEGDIPGTAAHPAMPDASCADNSGTFVNTIPEDITTDSPGGLSKFSTHFINPPADNTYSPLTTSILLDGVDEYIDFGNVASMSPERTDSFSWAIWIQTSTSATQYAFAKLASNRGWALGTNSSGEAYFELRKNIVDAISIESTSSVADGSWHLIVVTYNGSSASEGLEMYIDGVKQRASGVIKSGSIPTGTTVSSTSLLVGASDAGASNHFTGNVLHAAGWDKQLSRLEITELFNNSQPQDLSTASSAASLVFWTALGNGDGLGAGGVLDLSGNGNHGTANNIEVGDFVADVPASANFGRYVSIPTNRDLYKQNGTTWSISFWIKTTATSGGHCVGKFLDHPSQSGHGIDLDSSGRPRVIHRASAAGARVDRSDVSINDGDWHHVVGTQKKLAANNHVIRIYIDGSEVTTTVETNGMGNSSVSSGADFTVGAGDGGRDPLNAQISDVAQFHKVLSDSDVTDLYNSGSPPDIYDLDCVDWLTLWWKMGDNVGNYGDNVSFASTTKTGDSPGTGTFSNLSTRMSIATDRVIMGDVLDKEFDDAFSVSAWFFHTAISGGNKTIVSKWDGSTGWRFNLGSSAGSVRGLNFQFAGTGTLWIQTAEGSADLESAVARNRWHHVVITYDGGGDVSGATIYLDGVAQTSITVINSLSAGGSNAANFTIGNISATGSVLPGDIDEVTAWDKELSAAEVLDLYNNGIPADPSSETFSSNLEGWWKMDGLVTQADTWEDFTDIVWSTGNYSWIILEKPTTGSQLLIDCERSSSTDLRMYWSPGGNYVGGDITTKPTATDEITIQSAGDWHGNLGVFSSWVHLWHSEDGALTRVIVVNDQQDPSLFWILDEVEDPLPDNWSHPEIVGIFEGVDAVDRDVISDSPVTSIAVKAHQDGLGEFDITLGAMGNDGQAASFGGFSWVTQQFYGTVENELRTTSGYPMAPMLVTSDTTGARGVHGFLKDIWWGHEDRPLGTTLPDSVSTKRFVQFNHVVLPWTGDSETPIFGAPDFSTNMVDESINTNDGTLTNMDVTDVIADSPGGSFSIYSLELNGTDEYVVIGDVAELSFDRTDPFSMSLWFKTTTSSTDVMIGKMNSSGVGYEAGILSSGEIYFQLRVTSTSNHMRVDSTTTWDDGDWHHLVVTWDGDVAGGAAGANIYVDGSPQSLTTVFDTLSGSITNTAPFQIAARDGSIAPFDGQLDDVAVYDKELTSGEVTTIYNSGSPNDLTTNGPDGYLAGYWLMGDGLFTNPENNTDDGVFIGYGSVLPSDIRVTNYVMVGIDSGAPAGLFPAYHYWTVTDVPDLTGSQAGTLPFGGPLTNIQISAEYITVEIPESVN